MEKFLWKNDDGSFRKYSSWEFKFTQKMWLDNILTKILAYDGDENSLKNARTTLEHFISQPEYADAFDLELPDTYSTYTELEAKLAQKLFESIQDVFGHFTVRLTFGNMLDYYYKGDGVKIKIVRRPHTYDLVDMFNHIGLRTPTAYKEDMKLGKIGSGSKAYHLFGYFFLDSALELELDSGEIRHASFNFGALINIGSGRIEVGKGPTLSSLRRFSKVLGNRFASLYEKQRSAKIELKQTIDEFIEAQSDLYNELKKKIVAKINNLHKDKIIIIINRLL